MNIDIELEKIPLPVRIYFFRLIVKWLKERAKETDTPFDDYAVKLLRGYLAELLEIDDDPLSGDAA